MDHGNMTEKDFEGFLEEAIYTTADEADIETPCDVRSFQDAGIMTTDKGLIVTIGSAEFQVTILRTGR